MLPSPSESLTLCQPNGLSDALQPTLCPLPLTHDFALRVWQAEAPAGSSSSSRLPVAAHPSASPVGPWRDLYKGVARFRPAEVTEPAGPLSQSSTADSASEASQNSKQAGSGSGESVGSMPEGQGYPGYSQSERLVTGACGADVAPSVLAVERECRSRPQTRRARIRELLKRLEVAQSPCPADRLRVDARQKQAKERHLRQTSGAPAGPASSPALSLRRSRSFMELVATESEPQFSSSRSGPVDPSVLEDVVSRLPAKPVTSSAPREPCTICLEVPSSGPRRCSARSCTVFLARSFSL